MAQRILYPSVECRAALQAAEAALAQVKAGADPFQLTAAKAAMEEARQKGATIWSIVNAIGSQAMRIANGYISMQTGPEIGVASTKAFSAPLVDQYMLAILLAGFAYWLQRSWKLGLGVFIGLVVQPNADALEPDDRGFVVPGDGHVEASAVAIDVFRLTTSEFPMISGRDSSERPAARASSNSCW